jgi:hypothetical protein
MIFIDSRHLRRMTVALENQYVVPVEASFSYQLWSYRWRRRGTGVALGHLMTGADRRTTPSVLVRDSHCR